MPPFSQALEAAIAAVLAHIKAEHARVAAVSPAGMACAKCMSKQILNQILAHICLLGITNGLLAHLRACAELACAQTAAAQRAEIAAARRDASSQTDLEDILETPYNNTNRPSPFWRPALQVRSTAPCPTRTLLLFLTCCPDAVQAQQQTQDSQAQLHIFHIMTSGLLTKEIILLYGAPVVVSCESIEVCRWLTCIHMQRLIDAQRIGVQGRWIALRTLFEANFMAVGGEDVSIIEHGLEFFLLYKMVKDLILIQGVEIIVALAAPKLTAMACTGILGSTSLRPAPESPWTRSACWHLTAFWGP